MQDAGRCAAPLRWAVVQVPYAPRWKKWSWESCSGGRPGSGYIRLQLHCSWYVNGKNGVNDFMVAADRRGHRCCALGFVCASWNYGRPSPHAAYKELTPKGVSAELGAHLSGERRFHV